MSHEPDQPAGAAGPDSELSAADQSFVAGLLADLPAATMPADVAARIDAALAELPPLAEPAGPGAAATVVPFAAPSRPVPRWRSPRVLQVAAALVVVVGAGVVGVKAVTAHTSSPAASAASGAASAQVGTATTQSNGAYTAAALVPEVHSLLSGAAREAATPSAAAGGAVAAVPSPDTAAGGSTAPTADSPAPVSVGPLDPALRRLMSSTAALAPCIAAIENGLTAYVAPLAIDAGTYEGRPALIVVLPGADDPTSYDVWIVGPTCGASQDAALIRYQSVPRG
jgi:hypothetical protein